MDKLTQYERVFGHFDANGDGKISPSELRHCVEKLGGNMSPSDASIAVESIDSDGDGLLGIDDFVKLVEGERGGEKARDLREAFAMYVMDGRDCITPKSLRRMLGRLGESKTVAECECMISAFDLDGDGVLSFDEFLVMMA